MLTYLNVFPTDGLGSSAYGTPAPDPKLVVEKLERISKHLILHRPALIEGQMFLMANDIKSLAARILSVNETAVVLCSTAKFLWIRNILSSGIQPKNHTIVLLPSTYSTAASEEEAIFTLGMILGMRSELTAGLYVAYRSDIVKAHEVLSFDIATNKLVLASTG